MSALMSEAPNVVEAADIIQDLEVLPHRYPFRHGGPCPQHAQR